MLARVSMQRIVYAQSSVAFQQLFNISKLSGVAVPPNRKKYLGKPDTRIAKITKVLK